MATLKSGGEEIDATINGERIFSIGPGQVFLYDNINHHAYRQDGKMGFVEPEKIIRDTKSEVFKFKYSDDAFNFSNDNELIDLGRQFKVDFRDLILRVRKKDSNAFRDYLKHEGKMDGAAWQIYYETFWKLLNDWTDKELYELLRSFDLKTRKQFIEMMLLPVTTWPIEDQDKYYRRYYPTTFKQFIIRR